MALFLDILMVAVFALLILVGFKRGFIRSVAGLAASLFALLLASYFSAPLAETVFDGYLQQPIQSALSQQLDVSDPQALELSLNNTLQSMPQSIANLLRSQFGSTQEMAQSISSVLNDGQGNAAEHITQQWARPLAVSLLQVIILVVLFILLRLILGLITKALDKVCSNLPIIRRVNTLLGGAVGLIHGVLAVLLLSAVLQGIAVTNTADAALSTATLEQSTVLKWIVSVNPLSDLL